MKGRIFLLLLLLKGKKKISSQLLFTVLLIQPTRKKKYIKKNNYLFWLEALLDKKVKNQQYLQFKIFKEISVFVLMRLSEPKLN